MRDEGWSYGDLAGELMVRGIDIDDVGAGAIGGVLSCRRPEIAADRLFGSFEPDPPEPDFEPDFSHESEPTDDDAPYSDDEEEV